MKKYQIIYKKVRDLGLEFLPNVPINFDRGLDKTTLLISKIALSNYLLSSIREARPLRHPHRTSRGIKRVKEINMKKQIHKKFFNSPRLGVGKPFFVLNELTNWKSAKSVTEEFFALVERIINIYIGKPKK